MTYIARFHSLDGDRTYYVNTDDISHIVSRTNGSTIVFKTNHFDLEIRENEEEVYDELTIITRRS